MEAIPLKFQPVNIRSGSTRSGDWNPIYENLSSSTLDAAEKSFLCREICGEQNLLQSMKCTAYAVSERYCIGRSKLNNWVRNHKAGKPQNATAGCPNALGTDEQEVVKEHLVLARNAHAPLPQVEFGNLILGLAISNARKRKISCFSRIDSLDNRTLLKVRNQLDVSSLATHGSYLRQ